MRLRQNLLIAVRYKIYLIRNLLFFRNHDGSQDQETACNSANNYGGTVLYETKLRQPTSMH
jgi:hypothetical protein